MRLKDILSVLSKSSPYAVSTERENVVSKALDEVKEYLYIKTGIEADFLKQITSLSPTDKKIIFLCGSSGDGKSEILTRYSKKFSTRAKFHLDATHSFDPNTNAIETLDGLFTEFEEGCCPLVIGINVGMLGNYSQEGNCTKIRESIRSYLDKNEHAPNHIFLNFESYPKFTLDESSHSSAFVKEILKKITAQDDNLIRQYFDKEIGAANPDKKLCTNYRLLCIPEVQERIIDVLFKARLMKDQFLTARTLLDFIHTLLIGKNSSSGYLFDNLFEQTDNELSSKIIEFDPANHRTSRIDKFILSYSLGLRDNDFEEYVSFLSSELGIRRPNKPKPYSYLRLFYLLKNTKLGNEFHSKFSIDFSESLLERYSKVWNLHNQFSESPDSKLALKNFYRETVITAIRKYNNRNATNLDKGHYLISEHNGYQVVTEVVLRLNIDAIKLNKDETPSFFNAHLKLNDELLVIPININLLNLMEEIVKGYRPNKHDKNTVVLLDDLTDKISDIAARSKTLIIIKNDNNYKITNDDDDFEVSGM